MAVITIDNVSEFEGMVGTAAIEFDSSLATVSVVTGLTATKTADKMHWVNGEMTYTVVVANDASNDDFTGGVFSTTSLTRE